jgi:hypothetical protein
MEWLYFVLGFITWPIVRMSAVTISRELVDYRQRKFIKVVNIRFRDRPSIAFISVDSSDRRNMKKIERDLREQYGIEVEEEDPQEGLSLRMRKPSSLLHDPAKDHDEGF